MSNAAETLAEALRDLGTGQLVVVTGAGVSVASGIPTFRGTDPGAVWKTDVTELGTFDYFRRDPVGSWQWYLHRFDAVLDCEPNPAHTALADLERWHVERGGAFLLVTQNIDLLHERAGTERLIKVHGSSDRVRCATPGCEHGEPTGSLPRSDFDVDAFRAVPSEAHLPRCPRCGDVMRQHVLWFDEYYHAHEDYAWSVVEASASAADLLLFVGTSFSVGVTELFLWAALPRRIPVFSIDPGAEATRLSGLTTLTEPAESLLPETVRLVATDRPR